MARAAAVYTPLMTALVHRFKYGGKIQLRRPLGLLLFLAFRRYWGAEEIDVIIPVPLHKKRLRGRGFNQSHLLIRDWPRSGLELADQAPVPTIAKMAIDRIRHTLPQTGLGRKDRRRNIKNAFTVTSPRVIKNRHVLLVDDVYTTGATVDTCAQTLLSAGAAGVDVLTLARVV